MFLRNKVTVVLKVALLASQMGKYAIDLIEYLRKTWCVVSLIIVQIDLPVDWECIRSQKIKVHLGDWLRNTIRVEWRPTCRRKLCGKKNFQERMFVISPSLSRSIGYDTNSVRRTEDVIPTIFFKQCDVNCKRISGLMEKLNRKRVRMSDNMEILG